MALSVDIDAKQVEALVDAFGASEAQIQAAMRSAYGRMARWLRTKSVRELAPRLKIPARILRGRVRTYRMQNGVSGDGFGAKVWYGLRDVPFSKLGARKSGKGMVTKGGRYHEGAFEAQLFGRPQIVERVGKGRVPLRVVYAEIQEESTVYIEDNLIGTALFESQFFKFLEHEIRWRTSILK